jgi:hypothetical protein
MMDLGVPERRAELGQHVKCNRSIAENTSFIDRGEYQDLSDALLIWVGGDSLEWYRQPRSQDECRFVGIVGSWWKANKMQDFCRRGSDVQVLICSYYISERILAVIAE